MSQWSSITPAQSSLAQIENGWLLQCGSTTFAASHDTRALGVLCFAYGLDNELFHGVDPQSDAIRWLIWHFAALLSRREEDPDLPETLTQALAEACHLAPNEAVRTEVRSRVAARLQAIAEHFDVRLATLNAIREAKDGRCTPTRLEDL